MPVTLTINGVPFQYPVAGDKRGWGQPATGWATAVSNLLSQVTASSAPLADSGQLRLGNTDTIEWRNAADTNNVSVFVDSDDHLYYKNGADPAIDLTASANGNVTGPLSSTDNALPRFDGVSGQLLQNSLAILSDSGDLSGLNNLDMSGVLTAGAVSAGSLESTGGLDVDTNSLLHGILTVENTFTAEAGVVISGISGFSVSEEFANEVIEEYARPTGTTVGVRGVAVSNSSGSYTSTTATYEDVTNLSVTITTTGRPVRLALIGESDGILDSDLSVFGTPNSSTTRTMRLKGRFLRGVTAISDNTIGSSGFSVVSGTAIENAYTPEVFEHLDVIGAGTYTYKFQLGMTTAGTFSSGPTKSAVNVRLTAYEL